MVTVEIPLLNEAWEMPPQLRDHLYKQIFADPYNIKYEFYENWYEALPEEEKKKIKRIKLAKTY